MASTAATKSEAPVSSISKRPTLTVNTALPPAPSCSRKSLPTQRSASLSSLRASPCASLTTKRTSPRCTSPALSSTASTDRSSWLLSPGVSPSASRAVAPSSQLSPPITMELYFRLLKKSPVLDQLLEVSSHLESQQQHLQKLEADRAKTASVQEFVFLELETYKRKFVEAQKFMLELVESMASLSIKESELQRGTGSNEAREIAQETKEERVMEELQAMMSHQLEGQTEDVHGGRSLESSALRAVGMKHVEHLSSVCAEYEKQLVKSEGELSRAMHSAYKDECLAKLKQYEAMQSQHDNEVKQLTTRIEHLKHQTSELHGVIDDQRDEIAQLKQTNETLHQNLDQQSSAIEKFGAELKAELRKRYGLVPSVLDARWHEHFPGCAAPE